MTLETQLAAIDKAFGVTRPAGFDYVADAKRNMERTIERNKLPDDEICTDAFGLDVDSQASRAAGYRFDMLREKRS